MILQAMDVILIIGLGFRIFYDILLFYAEYYCIQMYSVSLKTTDVHPKPWDPLTMCRSYRHKGLSENRFYPQHDHLAGIIMINSQISRYALFSDKAKSRDCLNESSPTRGSSHVSLAKKQWSLTG